MSTKMEVLAKFGESPYSSGTKSSSITLNNADVRSLLRGDVSGRLIGMLQEVARQKIQHDLQAAEEANEIQRSNQVLIDGGLKMFALFSERGDSARKNPKSLIFLAKDKMAAQGEHGYLTNWGRRHGVIDEWKGSVPKYVLRVAGTIKHHPR